MSVTGSNVEVEIEIGLCILSGAGENQCLEESDDLNGDPQWTKCDESPSGFLVRKRYIRIAPR